MKDFLKKNKNVIIGTSILVFMLALDFVSKRLVHSSIKMYDEIRVIPYLFNFTHTHNTGAAFGIFQDSSVAKVIFIIISLVATLALGFGLIKYGAKSKVLSIGLGLIIAGALGNAIDRIFLGYVDDYIMFDFWKSFAVFNFADVSVIFGVIFLFIYILFIYKEPKKTENSLKKEVKKNDEEEII